MRNLGVDKPVVLCIGGSDPGAGAGLQTDEATILELGCTFRGVCAIETIQDKEGLHSVTPTPSEQLVEELKLALADGKVRAIKTGALGTIANVRAIYPLIKACSDTPLVVDPVATASKCANPGVRLLELGGIEALLQGIAGLATVVTPNGDEFEPADYSECHAVYLSGGHDVERTDGMICDQLLIPGEEPLRMESPRILGAELQHGTGCRLASALAAFLASGIPLAQAAPAAHVYMQQHLMQA